MTSAYLSKAEYNFTCFAKTCVDFVKLPLIDLLTNVIKPTDLRNEILKSSTLTTGKNKLRPDQLKICAIPLPDYHRFDVTLLYTLIRNLCPSLKPTKKWGIDPDARDTKIGDDIERLRLLRNKRFAHPNSTEIPDDEFKDLWKNVKSVIQRVQNFTKLWSKIDYEQELTKIESLRFGCEDREKYKLLLEATLNLSKLSEGKEEPKISITGPEKVLCGDKACFEAEIKQAESYSWSIIWQKVKGNVTQQICTSCEKYRISPNKQLVIPSVSLEDEGEYQAVLSRESNENSYRILSNVIYLQPIGDVPKATISSDQPVYYGSKTILNTQISSCSSPVGVKWQKSTDGNTFSCVDISEPKYYGSSLNPESPSLVITKTTFQDMLYYRLLVWNKIGEEFSNTISLKVIGRPPDVLTSHEIFIENRSVRLIGKIHVRDQFPEIQTVYWTKNGKRIDAHEEGEKYSEVSIENPSLIIYNVNHHDAGFYRLTAKNAVGSTESEIVLDEPRICFQRTENPDDYQCFTAIIKSTPEAYHAQWKIKGNNDDTFTPIDVNSGEYKGTSSSLPCPVLVVKRKELFDKYCFQIEVNNFVGCCIKELEISDHESLTIPDKVYRFGGKFSFNIFNKNGSTIRFNDLRRRLINGLKGTVIQELKDSLEVITSERKLTRDLNSVSDFFRYLLDEGILTECNVIILQYLMRTINRPDLEELCVQYATKDKKALCYYEDPRNIDKPKVHLHVLADIENFAKMDSLLQTVANIVGCSSTDIEIVGLKPDKSFILIITMREDFLNILKETNPLNLKILLTYNVDWIKIEDKIVTYYIAISDIKEESNSDSRLDEDEKKANLPASDYLRRYKNVKISVREGSLEKEKVDVIVNSTSVKLDLRLGRGSKALLTAAGERLQTECSQKYPTGIQKGEVAVTGPGNLGCKFIFHGCLNRYGSKDAEKIHMNFISKCLKELDNKRVSSIAFPGLTTGFRKFPKNVASKNACRAIAQYIDNNPNTSLKEVRFVIHPGDSETFMAFCEAVKAWDLDSYPEIEKKELCQFRMNRIAVTIKVDKIEEEEVDMVVNSEITSLDSDINSLYGAQATAVCLEVAEEYRRNRPASVTVVVTSAGNLKCKKTCRAFVPPHQNDNSVSTKVIQNIVIKCLEKADENNLTSVALPALGTRYTHYPVQVSAAGMLKGIDQFSKSHTLSSVKRVVIVLFGGHHRVEISKAFVDEAAAYRGACSGPERGTQGFFRQMSHRELRPPEYWTEFTSDKSVKLWKVNCDDGFFKLVDVDSTTYKAVEKLVQSTWQSKKIGLGRDAVGLSELNYTRLKVLKVQRLENIELYENYCRFRARLFHEAFTLVAFKQLSSISQKSKDIATTKCLEEDSILKSDLYPEINEHFLFHGTKPDTYKKILSQGLDCRMTEYCMFGQGVYLAESSTKADQYTDPRKMRSKNEKRMFLVRSCLGKIHLAKAKNPKLQRPPCFQTGCESDTCGHFERQRCDSVVGEGEWIFREFVTYHHHQTYPEYLITYDRV